MEKFNGSYRTFIVISFLLSLGVLFGVLEHGFQDNIKNALWWLVAGYIFTFLMAFFTTTKITPDKNLVNRTPLERGFKIDIFDITKIDRTSVFLIKKWGNRLQIHHKNNYSDDDWVTIREANYSVKTIKALLTRLKDINPSIKLHPQFQDLVDGKIEVDNSFKSEEIEGKTKQ